MAIQWNEAKIYQFVNSLENIADSALEGAVGKTQGRQYIKMDNGVLSTTNNKEACTKRQLAKTINDIMKSGIIDEYSRYAINNIMLVLKSTSPEGIKLKSNSISVLSKTAKVIEKQLFKVKKMLIYTNFRIVEGGAVFDGGHYKGKLKNGLFHGRGTLYLDNKMYVGIFKKGVFQYGFIKEYNPNNRREVTSYTEGVFKDGKIQWGERKEFGKTRNGTEYTCSYEGTFNAKGKLEGDGIIEIHYQDNKHVTVEGIFENGDMHYGTNIVITPKSDGTTVNEIYTGPFFHGKLHGQGKLITTDGEIKEGHFEHGKLTTNLNADDVSTPSEYAEIKKKFEALFTEHPIELPKRHSRPNKDD